MNYDDYQTQTPEEARRRRLGRPCFDSHGRSIVNQDDPPEEDDDEPEEPTDPEATPIMDDPEDPGEHLEPHTPDLGGES